MSDPIIRIDVMDREARAALTDLEYRQFPYALAKTLTQIGQGAMLRVRRETKRTFRLKSDFIPKGVAYISAKKTDVKNKGQASTVVFTKPGISGFMPIHEEGGIREPSSVPAKRVQGGKDTGASFTLPATKASLNIQRYSFKTGKGYIKKSYHPRTLLKEYAGQYRLGRSRSVAPGGRKGKPFLTKARSSGVLMLARRISRKQWPIEILYIFTRREKYHPVWGFEMAVRQHVDRKFKTRLARNLAVAIGRSR